MGAFVLFFLFFLLALTTTTPASKSDGDVGGTIRDLLERTDKRYIKKTNCMSSRSHLNLRHQQRKAVASTRKTNRTKA